MARVQAVFFDLFETLITEMHRERHTKASVAERLGIEPQVFAAKWREMNRARMTGAIPDYEAAIADICRSAGVAVDEALIHEIAGDRVAYHTGHFACLDDEVLRMLEDIRGMGVKTGLISNATSEEITALADCRLSELLDTVVVSCETGYAKPDPEIYLLACERLGVDPKRCLFVGDGGYNELPGAAAVGMRPYCAAWFVDRWPEEYQRRHSTTWGTADYPRLHSPGELITLLRDGES